MITVTTAACRFAGLCFTAPRPARHGDILRMMRNCGVPIENVRASQQGFMMSDGTFRNREDALGFARENKQIIKDCSPGSKDLFTENLW